MLAACTPRRAASARQAAKVDYKGIRQQSGPILDRIQQHVEILAALGPRQTGQAGCDKALDYVRDALADIVPGLQAHADPGEQVLTEISTTVTVPLDRRSVAELEPVRGHSHVVLFDGDSAPIEMPAYSFMPNCVQDCQTHASTECPLGQGSGFRVQGSGPESPSSLNPEPRTLIPSPNSDNSRCPNCERPRPLIDLRSGGWDDIAGKNLSGAVVLLDFNSGDAWLRAASLDAYGAIIAEPDQTTVFQADDKYLASVPMHWPRLYVKKDQADSLRRALERKGDGVRVQVASRLAWRNVTARGLELTIPGTNRDSCYVLAGHVDARSIVPDLSYGAAELYGLAELLELVRYFTADGRRPACDLKVLFVSGHWQQMGLMRDYLAPDGPNLARVGSYYRLAMGIDLVPAGQGLNILSESNWDCSSYRSFNWFRMNFFAEGGWRETILRELGYTRPVALPGTPRPAASTAVWPDPRQPAASEPGVEVFAGARPHISFTEDHVMADRNNRSPLTYAPRYPTAEEPWQTLNMPAFAFQTGRLTRLAHNTPLDTLEQVAREAVSNAPAHEQGLDTVTVARNQLRPQLEITLATLEHLLQYPQAMLPSSPAQPRKARGWGGYARLSGRILEWDRSIGWFAQRLPGEAPDPHAAGGGGGAGYRTFVHAVPADRVLSRELSPLADKRMRNYRPWPVLPSRSQHRELQAFTFGDLRLLDRADFRINTIYSAIPEIQYTVVGYTLDPAGRICRATDYGVHGDGNKAYQCTEVPLDTWDVNIPVSLFECGSLELFDLLDVQRYNPNLNPAGGWLFEGSSRIATAENGIAPFIRVQSAREIRSHTEIDRWGFTQYGPTAMVFLPAMPVSAGPAAPQSNAATRPSATTRPADARLAAEVLLGGHFTNFAVLNNPDAEGTPRGFSMESGQTVRLSDSGLPTPAECVRQLALLDAGRIEQFARHDVSSPLATRYHKESQAAIQTAEDARRRGDFQTARAHDLRSWVLESATYRSTLALLMDVVSTTVLYFVLLIPFSFLFERLFFPQRTTLRTVLVASVVFLVFAGLLYLFHPGFRLAHNILVITISFMIVVMSVPALILLLVRGVAMLRAIGSKAVITQRSEAESAGMVIASLSLAVSNMRRRKLRTALTLATITILVMALVLLTTSSAFDFRILEPTGAGQPSFEGLQIYNTADRRRTLIPEMVEVYERALKMQVAPGGQAPLVVRREFINYGYDHKSENACLYLTAGDKRVPVPYFQIMGAQDDLIEYAPPRNLAACPRFSRAHPGYAGGPIHLSDLMEGRFLQDGDIDVCLLPSTMAEMLGVKVGDEVRVMGLGLRVVGIWTSQIVDPGTFALMNGPLDNLIDLDGLPLTALQQSAWRQGQPDNPMHAPSREIVIVPRAWNERAGIFPTSIASLIVVPPKGAGTADAHAGTFAQAQQVAREILNVDVFSHVRDPLTGAGVSQRLSMRTATQIKGSSMMLVVLVVAVLMILAIMTGTVYERMKEIHILSSVGLSPRHVAGMFFVEALVYAGIAAVFGYFLGVIALKILLAHLKSTGQNVEFYPNYLGMFVLYSIGVAVAATLLSSLYPIRLASRIVNPSAGSDWKFSETEVESQASILLPFIATTWTEARGLMVYAYDFLAIHQGERSGRFVCQSPPRGMAAGQELRLEMPIWLAPFERNLSQQTILRAKPTPDGTWWELHLELHRLSGQDYLWRRGATSFVDLLRKHMLRWRAMSAQQEAQTALRADSVFGTVSTAGAPGGDDVDI